MLTLAPGLFNIWLLASLAPQLVVTCEVCRRPATKECWTCGMHICEFCTLKRHWKVGGAGWEGWGGLGGVGMGLRHEWMGGYQVGGWAGGGPQAAEGHMETQVRPLLHCLPKQLHGR